MEPSVTEDPSVVAGARVETGTIAVLTYRRPEELDRLVPMLFDQIADSGLPFDVLVVDNDAAGSAAAVLKGLDRPGLRWVVEPAPGIAAARNRALDECVDRDLLVFIDDDEAPHPDWLRHLVETRARTGAAAVAGAVVSEFAGELDPWIRQGGFFSRPRLATGTAVELAATNNLLVDLRVVRRLGLRFDERFGISGGSDSVFTRELVAAGGALVWCDEAVVTDHVPADRMTRKWVVRRWFRMGNTWSRAALTVAGAQGSVGRLRARLVASGLVRLAGGLARIVAGTVTGTTSRQADGCRVAARGAGMLLGATGVRYSEYRRR